VLRVDEQVFPLPSDGGLTEFPGWSREGFLGLINSGREYAMAAHIRVEQSGHDFEVFAYEPVSPKLLGALLPRMASTSFLELQNTDSEGLEYSATEGRVTGAPGSVAGGQPQPAVRFERQNREEMEVREAVVLPPSRAWWDIEVRWGTPLPVWRWEAGKSTDAPVLVIVVSRPSLIIRQLFSTLGPLAGSVLFAFSVIGALFLLVEIVSLVFGVGLTRSITRSVADLYQATLKVNAGDFSGRIPIRSKDQLSELGASFNQMTASIQKLIAESKEKERLESELEIAREVQSQLFPKEVPQLRGLEVTGLCRPARMVSGDYYDFVQLNSEWTAVAIGDIAGKGVSAALLMASIQSSLRAQLGSCLPLTNGTSSPVFAPSTAELTGALNRQLFESTSSEKFATFFVALYHERTSDLFYTNAGHLPPVLIRSGQPHRLEVNGMVLGAFPDQTYERGYLKLRPGDLLAAFTDGITEPENEYGEEFGEGRLIDLLTQNVNRPLNEIAQQVTDVVQEWGGPFEPPDDMTLLLLRRI
jgi:sigma-B regulation protein RsbU (phosphoserine phosphatase)